VAGNAIQSGTIPYRVTASGGVEILLITSRKRGRWVLPKGKVARGMLAHRSAERETLQEAGVVGEIEPIPIADILLRRKVPESPTRLLMYPLIVTSELLRWPEDHQRMRRWMPIALAIKKLDNPPLRKLLKRFAARRRGSDA